jgi:hypothetical protein
VKGKRKGADKGAVDVAEVETMTTALVQLMIKASLLSRRLDIVYIVHMLDGILRMRLIYILVSRSARDHKRAEELRLMGQSQMCMSARTHRIT